jgi:hypothetical protein
MVDELTQELAYNGVDVSVITPYYNWNKKGETGYLEKDGFKFEKYLFLFFLLHNFFLVSFLLLVMGSFQLGLLCGEGTSGMRHSL